MYLLYYYVPEKQLNEVNSKLFELGLGKIDNYDCCCWISKGRGQFRPLAGSNPHIGEQDQLEYIEEYKVEIICPSELKKQATDILLNVHPYETPAYGFLEILQ